MANRSLSARLALGVSLSVLVGAISVSAVPARAASASADRIETVVVTAQFRKQDAQKTPLAITAIDASMLQQRGQTSVVQVANETPNVTLKPRGALFGPSIAASIRGIGQSDFNPALEPGVGMYVDDVYYATLTGADFDLLDLNRVEILRGPQGTLAGMNSIGGAIKLYSKKPDGNGGGYLEGTYGSYSHIGARGDFDFTLIPDKLFMRVAAATKHQRGYVTRLDYGCTHPGSPIPSMAGAHGCVLGHEGGTSYTAGRIMLRWLPSNDVEVNVIADATDDNSENAATTLLYANNPNPNVAIDGVPFDSRFIPKNPYANYASFYMTGGLVGGVQTQPLIAHDQRHFRDGGVSASVDWRIADGISLKSISAYRQYTADWAEDNDVSPANLNLGIDHLSHRQLSQELRLNGSLFEGAVEYTLGGFYFSENSSYDSHQDIRYASPAFDFLGLNGIAAHSKAGFVHAVWHVTDKLNLTGGVRYSTFDKEDVFHRLNRDGTPSVVLGSLNGVVGSYSGTHWDYRANISYNWTSNVMTYAQVSTGFKGGGVNPRPFIASQVQPFGAESLTAYEVGFKSTLLDHRMMLNGAAFYDKYKNIQLTLLSCPQYSPFPGFPCALPSNAGDADIKGAELETQIYPVDGLQLDGSLSYLDFSYTRISAQAGGPSQPAGVQMGMVTPYTPRWKWSAGIQYAIPVSDVGTLTPRLDASYQSAIYTAAVNDNGNRINGYTLLNARLMWAPPASDWKVTFAVTNLANKLYYLSKFEAPASAGFIEGVPGAPREWSVTISKRF